MLVKEELDFYVARRGQLEASIRDKWSRAAKFKPDGGSETFKLQSSMNLNLGEAIYITADPCGYGYRSEVVNEAVRTLVRFLAGEDIDAA